MYSLQEKVVAENELLTSAILDNDVQGLVRILSIMGQLETQLLENYKLILDDLESCY